MQVEYGIEVDIYGFGVMMGELLAHQVNLRSLLEACVTELTLTTGALAARTSKGGVQASCSWPSTRVATGTSQQGT